MGDAFGGGVMVAIAAALWIAYLLPSWLHRRQYSAIERNAVRLQQTLRILAETSETPHEVRLEATARAVASQERVLREQEAAERARLKAAEEAARLERVRAEREAAERLRAARAAADAPTLRRRALRRMRAATSIVLLLSLAALSIGIVAAIAGAGLVLAGAGVVGVAGSLVMLSALARRSRVVRSVAAPVPVAPAFQPVEWAAEEEPVASAWTPQPLPKPLYQAKGSVAAVAMDTADAAAALRRAAVFEAMSQRAAEINAGQVRSIRPVAEPVAPAASASRPNAAADRFAAMGIVGEAEPALNDLDAVLRRRRAG